MHHLYTSEKLIPYHLNITMFGIVDPTQAALAGAAVGVLVVLLILWILGTWSDPCGDGYEFKPIEFVKDANGKDTDVFKAGTGTCSKKAAMYGRRR